MEIQNLRRTSGGGTLVALFDLQATPDIVLQDWQLRDTPKGLRAFPPSPRSGRSTARVAPDTFSEIGRLASSAYKEGSVPNERITAA